ncbi:CopD family protein [Hufsiella ginkgonis]|uniref:Protoporphyrinogen IX oxidase n=1 Tax=Hufsiella ginkgonis TaxID=2695274 RepID=A0A7K1Y1R3_9SPHI|nr:CopD family protein [Hufsiella ginkgonis]MXV17193.1 protoporphyrinogen IX oxidase [Hufsiella ginkgonis]
MEYYGYLKSLHIIFVVSWMAGLLYIVRLFIYHTEANDRAEPDRQILHHQFVKMEKLLWNVIATPAMILAALTGVYMMIVLEWYRQPWMLVKLGFVIGLLVYHFICQGIVTKLKEGNSAWTSTQLRIWNEVATLFLVAIVFTVVLKSAMNWIYGTIGFVLFGVMIMIAVKIYKYYRTKD